MLRDLQFDFRLHATRSNMSGTQYFELLPGGYAGKHWNQQSRFIHENTFCLIEGIFEKYVPGYDHYGFVEIPRSAWEIILLDLASARMALEAVQRSSSFVLPYGSVVNVQESFKTLRDVNAQALATLIAEMDRWLNQTLRTQDVISVLGL